MDSIENGNVIENGNAGNSDTGFTVDNLRNESGAYDDSKVEQLVKDYNQAKHQEKFYHTKLSQVQGMPKDVSEYANFKSSNESIQAIIDNKDSDLGKGIKARFDDLDNFCKEHEIGLKANGAMKDYLLQMMSETGEIDLRSKEEKDNAVRAFLSKEQEALNEIRPGTDLKKLFDDTVSTLKDGYIPFNDTEKEIMQNMIMRGTHKELLFVDKLLTMYRQSSIPVTSSDTVLDEAAFQAKYNAETDPHKRAELARQHAAAKRGE